MPPAGNIAGNGGHEGIVVIVHERALVDLGAAIEILGHAPHRLGNRKIADPHLAEIVVDIPAKPVENLLANERRGIGCPRKLPQQQHQMQHNHVQTACHSIRHPIITIE